MAKQKIVMKVSMKDEKKRSKVLQTAVESQGVTSASLEGDKVVVEGDGIDSVSLTTALRKQVGFAELVSVAEKKEEKKEDEVKWVWSYPPPIQVLEPYPSYNPNCTIL